MSQEIKLFSDGGGNKDSAAAGACILDLGEERRRFIIYLGSGTNNEAEISSGLVGFAFLSNFLDGESSLPVSWISDSEYTLKSATNYIFNWQRNGWKTANRQPVKNQGLWRTYLELSDGLKIAPEHVKGHSGHEENEACDSASTWAIENGDSLLSSSGAKVIMETGPSSEWTLLDGRLFLSIAREQNESAAAGELTNLVAGVASTEAAPKTKSSSGVFEEIEELLSKKKPTQADWGKLKKLFSKIKT